MPLLWGPNKLIMHDKYEVSIFHNLKLSESKILLQVEKQTNGQDKTICPDHIIEGHENNSEIISIMFKL